MTLRKDPDLLIWGDDNNLLPSVPPQPTTRWIGRSVHDERVGIVEGNRVRKMEASDMGRRRGRREREENEGGLGMESWGEFGESSCSVDFAHKLRAIEEQTPCLPPSVRAHKNLMLAHTHIFISESLYYTTNQCQLPP